MTQTDAPSQQFDLGALTEPVGRVEAFLDRFLADRPLPDNLREAIRYALLGGGKRLRPILVLHACRAVGGEFEHALPPAAAIEMIHAFSLVHDDLPAMDDDDLRRGRPTLHRHTSEAMAILAGDAMTSLAFELILTRVADRELTCRCTAELTTATSDMIAGQVYDTLPDFDEAMPPLDRLKTIHRHKTGALLRAACRMGGICGGASESQLGALTRYAEAIGLMFQVVDDLLDVTQTTEQLGKAAGKDADKGKLTYPGLLGIDASRAEVERLKGEADAALEELGEFARPLRELCHYMAVREK
ncbi:MAG: polyprenyl synthetase family protein [Phycisphaeraceae bacterium]